MVIIIVRYSNDSISKHIKRDVSGTIFIYYQQNSILFLEFATRSSKALKLARLCSGVRLSTCCALAMKRRASSP